MITCQAQSDWWKSESDAIGKGQEGERGWERVEGGERETKSVNKKYMSGDVEGNREGEVSKSANMGLVKEENREISKKKQLLKNN